MDQRLYGGGGGGVMLSMDIFSVSKSNILKGNIVFLSTQILRFALLEVIPFSVHTHLGLSYTSCVHISLCKPPPLSSEPTHTASYIILDKFLKFELFPVVSSFVVRYSGYFLVVYK